MAYDGECFCGAVKIEARGRAAGDGLLPLPLVPLVVRRTGQRLHALGARRGQGHRWRGTASPPISRRRSASASTAPSAVAT